MTHQRTKIEITPEVTRQIAVRKALGTSIRELEAEFGFSRTVINRVLSSDLARGIVKEVTDSAVAGAMLAVKKELANMSELAVNALRKNLEDGSIEAVKVYFKALGMDATEKFDSNQQQTIQVILPTSPQEPKDVINENN